MVKSLQLPISELLADVGIKSRVMFFQEILQLNLQMGDYYEDLGIDWMTILNWFLRKRKIVKLSNWKGSAIDKACYS